MLNFISRITLFFLFLIPVAGLSQQIELIGNPVEIHYHDLEQRSAGNSDSKENIELATTSRVQLTLNNGKKLFPTEIFSHGIRLSIYRKLEVARLFDNSQELAEWSKTQDTKNGGYKVTGIPYGADEIVFVCHRYATVARLELPTHLKNPLPEYGELITSSLAGLEQFGIFRCSLKNTGETYLLYFEADHSIYATEDLESLHAAFVSDDSPVLLTQPELDTLISETRFQDSIYWSVELPQAYYELIIKAIYQSEKVGDAAVQRLEELMEQTALEHIETMRTTETGETEYRYFENFGNEESARIGLESIKMSRDRTSAFGKGAGLRTAHSRLTKWIIDGKVVQGTLTINRDFKDTVADLTKKLDEQDPMVTK